MTELITQCLRGSQPPLKCCLYLWSLSFDHYQELVTTFEHRIIDRQVNWQLLFYIQLSLKLSRQMSALASIHLWPCLQFLSVKIANRIINKGGNPTPTRNSFDFFPGRNTKLCLCVYKDLLQAFSLCKIQVGRHLWNSIYSKGHSQGKTQSWVNYLIS